MGERKLGLKNLMENMLETIPFAGDRVVMQKSEEISV